MWTPQVKFSWHFTLKASDSNCQQSRTHAWLNRVKTRRVGQHQQDFEINMNAQDLA
jgi:hypothetical protein